jgi:required for meiotic nuclear division protein 1
MPLPPESPTLRLTQHPGPLREHRLRAEYFEGQIDTKAFRAAHPEYPVLRSNPLLLQPELDRWIYVERFGSVVFWDCSDALIQQFLDELKQLPQTGRRMEAAEDHLAVFTGAEKDEVDFNSVRLRELSPETLCIISLTLAQSVALDYFENAVRQAMTRFQPVVAELRERGRLTLRHREVVKLVGFALETRAVVLDNLTLFDDPPESWESESLAHLDSALYDQFDLEERIEAINRKLAYLNDAGDTLMDILNSRKAHGLEWIVIVLILIETVAFMWTEIAKLFHG